MSTGVLAIWHVHLIVWLNFVQGSQPSESQSHVHTSRNTSEYRFQIPWKETPKSKNEYQFQAPAPQSQYTFTRQYSVRNTKDTRGRKVRQLCVIQGALQLLEICMNVHFLECQGPWSF